MNGCINIDNMFWMFYLVRLYLVVVKWYSVKIIDCNNVKRLKCLVWWMGICFNLKFEIRRNYYIKVFVLNIYIYL